VAFQGLSSMELVRYSEATESCPRDRPSPRPLRPITFHLSGFFSMVAFSCLAIPFTRMLAVTAPASDKLSGPVDIRQRGREENGASSAVNPTIHGASFHGYSIVHVYVDVCKCGAKGLWAFYKQENKESTLLPRRVWGSGKYRQNILINTALEMSVFD
jgi:hypothetical protein